MQLIAIIVTLLLSSAATIGWVPVSELPACDAPGTRALIRTAVERQLLIHGLPPQPELFTLLRQLKDATSPEAKALTAQLQEAISMRLSNFKVCEVNDRSMGTPMFVTMFVGGFGIPQPSGYVLNFGIPGAYALIGNPPN